MSVRLLECPDPCTVLALAGSREEVQKYLSQLSDFLLRACTLTGVSIFRTGKASVWLLAVSFLDESEAQSLHKIVEDLAEQSPLSA